MAHIQRPLCRCLAVGAAALLLSACVSADVSTIDTATRDDIDAIKITDVVVEIETPKPNPGLKAALTDELRKAMEVCSTGNVDHRMMVTITDFEDQNVAKAIFIGDEIELKGEVKLIDMSTDQQTASYFVERSFFWGGFIGAAMMSDAEASLSEGFAESVCEEVFGVDYTSSS